MTYRRLLPIVAVGLLLPSCAGEKLRGQVAGTQTTLQRAIKDGSKTIGCAPKETALAEANIKFAEDALTMGEYYRGKEHVQLADTYTQLAVAKTEPVRCHYAGPVKAADLPKPGDRDGDGFLDDVDKCPDDPEDKDDFEDDDGCPDRDNDQDGVFDADTYENGRWITKDQKIVDGQPLDCRNDPEDKDGFEDEDGCPDPDNDQDGILDVDDKCPNDPEDIDQFEDEDGCPDPDNDKDGILDVDDKCPLQPEVFNNIDDEDGCPDYEGVKIDPCAIKLDDKVYFEFNKWNIDPRSYSLLDQVVAALNGNPEVTIEIGGHTDSKGKDKYNKKLSQKRVDSVLEYLVGKGIARSRLVSVGYGESQPIDTNRSAAGRANNRRVEFNRTDNPECNK
jgi:outer membrane protein OmpA-like peptidoglycan-associated protein